MKTLLLTDSSFYIKSQRLGENPFPVLAAHKARYEFATCGMVRAEVLSGMRVPRAFSFLKREFDQLRYLPSTLSTWDLATRVAWGLERRGLRIPMTDVLIAACALENDATVFSYDRHFHQVPDLKVIDRLA